jgi:hypothetical protein
MAMSLVIGLVATPSFAQTYQVNNRQVRTLLNRIEQRTDTLKYQIDRSLDNGGLNNSRSEDYINGVFANFETSADRMRQNFQAGSNISSDLQDTLNQARYIESFMRDYRFNTQATNTWNLIKTDLSQLSRYYNVGWNWNGNSFPNNNNSILTGTYRLNTSRSDDVDRVIDVAMGNTANRDRMRTNLQRRLAVPEYLAIEKMNNQITMASSNAARTSFQVNGQTVRETMPNGRVMNTNATFYGNRLEITSDGDQTNAFYISFEPINNGESLRVTRRLNLERRGQTITVVSVYDRTANVAQWNLYNNDNRNPDSSSVANNSFYVPNGTRIVATLDSNLSTRQNAQGDRFVMTVTQPAAYQGARIEGTIDRLERSGRLTGRAEMNLNFETIRLRNGDTYRFEGLIDRITTLNGRAITIDNEDSVRGSNQTRDTVVRTGIGAVIGAIIGGIAGGGDGAAVGAAIGAGAGGGSVLIQGRGDLELEGGTTFEIRSSAPGNIAYRQ